MPSCQPHSFICFTPLLALDFMLSCSFLCVVLSRSTYRHFTRLNAFTNYTALQIEDPYSPYLRAGNYINYGKSLLADAEKQQRAAVFGSADIMFLDLPEINHILYEDPCKVKKERFEELDIQIGDYYWKNCGVVAEGVFKKGLYAMWLHTVGTFPHLSLLRHPP